MSKEISYVEGHNAGQIYLEHGFVGPKLCVSRRIRVLSRKDNYLAPCQGRKQTASGLFLLLICLLCEKNARSVVCRAKNFCSRVGSEAQSKDDGGGGRERDFSSFSLQFAAGV